MKKTTIYRIVNKHTGMCYIGQTTDLKKRIQNHFTSALISGNVGSWNDVIRQYGLHSFEVNVLLEIDQKEEFYDSKIALILENYFIDKYDSINNGYNSVKNIFQSDFNESNHVNDKKRKEERNPKPHSNRGKQKRSVNQYDLEGNFIRRFDTVSGAGYETETSKGAISICCQRKKPTANGYMWQYEDDDDINALIELKNSTYTVPSRVKRFKEAGLKPKSVRKVVEGFKKSEPFKITV